MALLKRIGEEKLQLAYLHALCVCVCVCVCECVCESVCVCACVCVFVYMYVCMYVCVKESAVSSAPYFHSRHSPRGRLS